MKAYIKLGFSVAIIALALFGAHIIGFWVQLGAHPFWSQSATLLGLGFGLIVIGLILPRPSWGVIILLLILTALALQTSSSGKETFAISYAENRYAGQIWHFGFVGFVTGLFASISALSAKFINRA